MKVGRTGLEVRRRYAPGGESRRPTVMQNHAGERGEAFHQVLTKGDSHDASIVP